METENTEPLGISKLVALIGDENIQFQNLAHNTTHVSNPKHRRHSAITFNCAPDIGQEFAAALACGQTPRKTGLIIWFDTDKFLNDPSNGQVNFKYK